MTPRQLKEEPIQIYANKDEGWVEFSGSLSDYPCLECGGEAERLVPVKEGMVWAMCGDCAHEAQGESAEAAHREQYEGAWDE